MNIETIRNVHSVRVCNGSGVIVRPLDRSCLYVLTNCHVVCGGDGKEKALTFKFETDSILNGVGVSVVDTILCEEKDMAIIKINADGFENLGFLRLNTCCNNAKFHVGFPKARYEGAVSPTLVLNIQNVNGRANAFLTEYEYTKQVEKNEIEGMSGGGVFDENCCLVGIHKQSSNKDEKEMLGNACFIPISCYKELLTEEGWSPILEFNLDSFVELTRIAFNFDDKSVLRNAELLLYEINTYKSRIEELSPVKIIEVLTKNGRLDRNIAVDELSRDFWTDFTEFVIAMIILLDIEDKQEDFIISVFDKFHFVFSQKQFDFYDVREELDLDLLCGMSKGAKLVVGGIAEPKTFNACVMDNRIPNISEAGVFQTMDIARHQRQLLSKLTIINSKIFRKCVYHILDEAELDVTLAHYRDVLMAKIKKSGK